jgi:tryptophanyl-tRNA synthetase
LRENIRKTAALFVAAGVDPEKSHIFIQSENPNHANLAWVLNCFTPFGQLERMTQFKDKSLKQAENTTAGLFVYPTLMAADILLYDTDEVPVGDDQKQHIELTRDVAQKFNSRYGEIFKLPEPRIHKETARIMSLAIPASKMSKSDADQNGVISLLDDPDMIRNKVKRAVTDSGSEITKSADKPAVSNLLTIFEVVSGKSTSELESAYQGSGYGKFKEDLAEAIIEFVKPIQTKFEEITSSPDQLDSILDKGREYVISQSSPKLEEVYKVVGLGR